MKNVNILIAAVAAFAAAPAMAQKAGTWSAELGVTQLAPQVTSGDLSPPAFPNTKVDVTDSTQLSGGVNYMLSDNIALNVPLGLGFKHNIVGAARAAGFGKLAEVRVLPITLLGQYRFLDAGATFRPYVGAGLVYANFYKEKGTAALTALTNPGGAAVTMSVQSKLAPALQLGGVFNINDKWYVNAHYVKTFLKTKATLSTGQTQNITLDPNALSVAVGYKF
jgi:outer membrane protein